MAAFEPGPIAAALMPLGPRVSRPGLFVGLAVGIEPQLVGVDRGLSVARQDLAPLAETDLETQFAEDIVPAADGLVDLASAGEAPELTEALDAGDAFDAAIGQSVNDLPAPGQAQPSGDLYRPIEPMAGGADG